MDNSENNINSACENEQAIEKLEEQSVKSTFEYINLLVLSTVLIAVFAVFIVFGGDSGEMPELNCNSFFSGEYTRSLEKKYKEGSEFKEQIGWINERLSFCFGIGNKLSVKSHNGENTVPQRPEPESQAEPPSDEKIIVTSGEKTKVTEISEEKTAKTVKTEKSTKTTQSALPRPTETEEEYTSETESETELPPETPKLPATNNEPPKVSVVITTLPEDSDE